METLNLYSWKTMKIHKLIQIQKEEKLLLDKHKDKKRMRKKVKEEVKEEPNNVHNNDNLEI